MPIETLSPKATTAEGRSISFRPASLYDDAVAFGKANADRPNGTELNASEVVCLALRRLFTSEGFEVGPAKNGRATYLAKVDAAYDRPQTRKKIERLLAADEQERLSR